MADLNALIAQGAQFRQAPDPFVQFGQMQQLEQGRQTNELNRMKMQEAQATMEERNALRQLNPSAADYESQLFKVNPTLGIAYRKEASAAAAQKIAGEKQTTESAKLRQGMLGQAFRDISSRPSDANITAHMEDVLASTLFTPEEKAKVQKQSSTLLAMPVEERGSFLSSQGATAGDISTAATAAAGQNVTMRGQDLTAGTAAAGQNVTMRGQDLTSAIGVERNRIALGQLGVAQGNLGVNRAGLGIRAIAADPYNISGVQAAFPIPGAVVAGAPSTTEKQPSGAPVVQNVAEAIKAGLKGEDLLTHLPTSFANQIRAIGEGREPSPAARSLTTPAGRQLMGLVSAAYPDYDAKQYATMGAAEKAFTSGKKGDTTRSFNVAIDHLGTLQQVSDALQNGDMRLFNQAGNFIALQTGNPAPTDFAAVKRIVADEVTKAVLGGAGALGDRKAVDDAIASSNSPAQLKQVIDRYKQLMGGQLNGLEQQYTASTGKKDFRTKFLTPTTQSAIGNAAATPSAAPNIDALLNKYK